MATATLTTDIVTIAVGEATDSGTWDGGKSNLHDTATYIEGAGSEQFIANSAGTAILYFQPTSSVSVGTSSVLRIWAMITDSFRADLKANGGIKVYATNGSAATWNYHGSDTLNTLWTQFVVDTGTTPSSGANPFGSNITQFGIQIEFTFLGKNTPTCWVDAIRHGNLITGYGGTSGDEIGIEEIFVQDDVDKLGVLMKSLETGVYSVRGHVAIGDNAGTATTYFLTQGKVIIAEAFDWGATDMLQMTFQGNATGTTDIKLLGCFVAATDDYMTINTSDTDIDSLEFSGNTFKNIYGFAFQSGFDISSNVFSACYQITPNACTFASNTIADSPDTDGALRWTSDISISSCSFNDNVRAIVVPSTETSITFNSLYFSGNTTDIYWEGTGGTLTVNISGGTASLVTGSAGGTVNVVSGVTITVESQVSLIGAEIRIYDVDGAGATDFGTELFGVESSSTATYAFTTSSSNLVYIQVMLDGYVEFGQKFTTPASSTTFTAQLTQETNT